MAANPRDILLRPIITEKTSVMLQDNKYTFQVPLTANKVEIRQAVEQIFKVKVLNVILYAYLAKPNAWVNTLANVPIIRKQS